MPLNRQRKSGSSKPVGRKALRNLAWRISKRSVALINRRSEAFRAKIDGREREKRRGRKKKIKRNVRFVCGYEKLRVVNDRINVCPSVGTFIDKIKHDIDQSFSLSKNGIWIDMSVLSFFLFFVSRLFFFFLVFFWHDRKFRLTIRIG